MYSGFVMVVAVPDCLVVIEFQYLLSGENRIICNSCCRYCGAAWLSRYCE